MSITTTSISHVYIMTLKCLRPLSHVSIIINTTSHIFRCSLHHAVPHCNTLQHHTAAHCSTLHHMVAHVGCSLYHAVTHCNSAQQTAKHCTTHSNTLQHTATHCNTLQHTAKRCNTLQHTVAHVGCSLHRTATHCNTLQHTATHCNTLQHTATHCNTLQHIATRTGCNVDPLPHVSIHCHKKFQVSFAEYRLFYRALLPKRPIILSSQLIIVTPYHMCPSTVTYLCLCSRHD